MRLLLAFLTFASFAAEPRVRKFKLDISVSVDKMPTLTNQMDFWMPLPYSDSYQSVSKGNLEAPYIYKIEKDQFGNQMLHMRVMKPLQTSFLLDLQLVIKRKEHVSGSGSTAEADLNLRHWLQPDRQIPLDEKTRALAAAVVVGAITDVDKARAIFNHVVDTFNVDKNDLAKFIAYARALGIPARPSFGLRLPEHRGEGKIAGFDSWAEFYSKGAGWIPVDPSKAAQDSSKRDYYFGAQDENRIELTQGQDLILTPKQQGEPLINFVYPYVEVDGKPFASVKTTYRYQDVK